MSSPTSLESAMAYPHAHPPPPSTYRPTPLNPDLEARLAAAPKAPKRMLAAQAQSREFGKRLASFREEVGGLCGRGGLDGREGRGRGRGKERAGQEGRFGAKRAVSCDRFSSRTEEWNLREDDAGKHWPGAEQRSQDTQGTPPPTAPTPPRLTKILSRHDLQHTSRPFASSPLASPFTTPAPSPPLPPTSQAHSPASSANSNPKDPLTTYLLHQQTLLHTPTLSPHHRASYALAHFATARALLLLEHLPVRAAEIFERVRRTFGLENAVGATREAERVILGREVRHWKVGVEGDGKYGGVGGGREGRAWFVALAGAFEGLGEVALDGYAGGGAKVEQDGAKMDSDVATGREEGVRGQHEYWNPTADTTAQAHDHFPGLGGAYAYEAYPTSLLTFTPAPVQEVRGSGFKRAGRGIRGRDSGRGRGRGRGLGGQGGQNRVLGDGGFGGWGASLGDFMPDC